MDCGLTTWGPLGAYNAGNYKDGGGTYHVNEVFMEFGVPLINDTFWGKADLDVAGRHARYSTAGDANTWKVGVTWDTPVPGIRLRAMQSRDIRAPNLSELEPPPVGANGSFNNDFITNTDNGHNLIGVTAGNITSEAGAGVHDGSRYRMAAGFHPGLPGFGRLLPDQCAERYLGDRFAADG